MTRLWIAMTICLLSCATSHATLKVTGNGDRQRLDPSGFPPDMQSAYQLMEHKCVKCHTLERTVTALKTGIAPISGLEFDKKSATAYGVKMMRKPDAGMSAQEAKAIVNLLIYLIDEEARK
jgi:hypothetical protein